MILTDREILAAIRTEQIVIDPAPKLEAFSSTSLDLTLDGRATGWQNPAAGVDMILDPGKLWDRRCVMIKKTGGGKYRVVSEKTGKPLSKPTTKEKAVSRLRAIEFFKHHPGAKRK